MRISDLSCTEAHISSPLAITQRTNDCTFAPSARQCSPKEKVHACSTNSTRTFWSLATTFLFSLLTASLCSCCSYMSRTHSWTVSMTSCWNFRNLQSQVSYLDFSSVLIFPRMHVLNNAPHLLQLQCQKCVSDLTYANVHDSAS